MSPKRLRKEYEQQCARKRVHYHAGTAIQHAAELSRKSPGDKLAIYSCDFCAQLHVGHRDNTIPDDPIEELWTQFSISNLKKKLSSHLRSRVSPSSGIPSQTLKVLPQIALTTNVPGPQVYEFRSQPKKFKNV